MFKVWDSGRFADFEVVKWFHGSAKYKVNAINIAAAIVTDNKALEVSLNQRVIVKTTNLLGQEINPDRKSLKPEVLFNVYDDGTVEKVIR